MTTPQQKINETFMEKLDNLQDKLNDICVKIASLPEDMAVKFDNRYASKASEIRLNNLETRIESRNYDWIKQLAVTLITIIISLAVYNKIG